jgi:hypothetical protein
MGSPHQVSPTAEKIVDRSMDRKKPLGLPSGLEASHLALALASGLMGDLGPIMQTSVLAMGNTGQPLPGRNLVAPQLIGDNKTGNRVQPLQ